MEREIMGRNLIALRLLAGFILVATLAAASPDVGAGEACEPTRPTTCTLRELATLADFRVGSTAEADEVVPGPYAETLVREFNSLTPENALKWYTVQPTDGGFNWGPGDAVVEFAAANDLEVRGHTLVWAQDVWTPAWVLGVTDPATMRAELAEHIAAVVNRYEDRVRRWDVVNEPLETLGAGPSDNVFARVLGTGWIGEAFALAAEADPTAELWLNEYGTDWVPGKHEALLALVESLLADGVAIHGIGLQMHRLGPDGPDPDTLEAQLTDFTDLGLEVAITELDIPVSPTDPDALPKQADAYRRIFSTCLAVTGCVEITTWGVTDAATWLDSLGLFPTPTRPLLFDDDFNPKPAYHAVREALAAVASPTTTTTPTRPSVTPAAPVAATAVAATPRFTG
jgi:endo-1,4-beta-xylanase